MPDHLITCPNPACAKPLHLPEGAADKPLSCPYCQSELKVTVTATGEIAAVTMDRKGGLRVPRQFLVPGFALLILGLAGLVVNGYIALQCRQQEGFALRYARHRVQDLRNGEELTASRKADDAEETDKAKEKRLKQEATPEEVFGALAGGAATTAMTANADEMRAIAWAPWIYPSRWVALALGAVTAFGGLCTLRGRGYAFALLGCVAAIVNVNELGCCFPGAIAGVWGILMLVRDDGRRYFRIAPRGNAAKARSPVARGEPDSL